MADDGDSNSAVRTVSVAEEKISAVINVGGINVGQACIWAGAGNNGRCKNRENVSNGRNSRQEKSDRMTSCDVLSDDLRGAVDENPHANRATGK